MVEELDEVGHGQHCAQQGPQEAMVEQAVTPTGAVPQVVDAQGQQQQGHGDDYQAEGVPREAGGQVATVGTHERLGQATPHAGHVQQAQEGTPRLLVLDVGTGEQKHQGDEQRDGRPQDALVVGADGQMGQPIILRSRTICEAMSRFTSLTTPGRANSR